MARRLRRMEAQKRCVMKLNNQVEGTFFKINNSDLITGKIIYFPDFIGSICRNTASGRDTKQMV